LYGIRFEVVYILSYKVLVGLTAVLKLIAIAVMAVGLMTTAVIAVIAKTAEGDKTREGRKWSGDVR
jgi:hypothetical protein